MNDHPANPINEADLLAFVEDELAEEREAAVLRALAANPEQARLAQGMRADREAIQSLPQVPAPTGLLGAVDKALEREMLLGLTDGQHVRNGLPVSAVRHVRPSPFKLLLDPRTHKLALAAAVLLIGAGATLQALKLINTPGSTATPERSLAHNENAPAEDQIAAKPDSEPATTGLPDQTPDLSLAKAEPVEQAQPAMSLDEALALADQGKLMIRVRTKTPMRTLDEIDRLAQRSTQGSSWLMEADITGTLTKAMNPRPPHPTPPKTVPNPIEEITYAGGEESRRELPELPRQEPINPILTLPSTRAYMISTPLDTQTLESILAQLDSRTDLEATFEALEEPVIQAPLPLDSGSVFWWTRPPTFWTKNVNIPVLVEPASD